MDAFVQIQFPIWRKHILAFRNPIILSVQKDIAAVEIIKAIADLRLSRFKISYQAASPVVRESRKE